jgi:hypothetical protein
MQKKQPRLDSSFWALLAEYNPHGLDLSADDVRAWFDFVWPQYAARRYSKHQRAITSWWSRARVWEVERAIARRDEIANQADNARLEKEAESESREANVVRIDHFAKLRARG